MLDFLRQQTAPYEDPNAWGVAELAIVKAGLGKVGVTEELDVEQWAALCEAAGWVDVTDGKFPGASHG